ncbi:cation-translocating P-type ATPase [Aliidiomarina soli]|uniref:Carbonate dehydratase n=1 Tax=Aliidiomarina soli TaxID=1928574 RepID=A0A432WMA7_9GAMM|nr:HAD-IC family P-type ATPase [Aliidiomarina soli]RUO34923.1 carbonate dehydratase [Aliidiomarina soli]
MANKDSDSAQRAQTAWYQTTIDQVSKAFATDHKHGLTDAQAGQLREQYGDNRLPDKKRDPAWKRLLKQLNNLLIVVLLVAAALAAVLAEWLEVMVILAVVMVNVLIGFFQEGKAEKALQAIQGMLAEYSQVIRQGHKQQIESTQLVPGDLLLLEAGDKVAADVRLVKVNNLALQEAALTGESVAVEKHSSTLDHTMPLAERSNMAFAGTLVTQGQGQGIVVATGANTELGHVNQMLASVEQLTTPLLRQMAQFARYLTMAILLVGVLVFALGMLRGNDASYMFMAVVSLVVAAIPEGLPTILTVALAIGVTRMASRHAIIRRLPAVETIGAVSIICSDKTGTLTRNEMTATALVSPQGRFEVSGVGYAPHGDIQGDSGVRAEQRIFEIALLCNEAHLVEDENGFQVRGDPMEGALLALAGKAGLDTKSIRQQWPRSDEIPFDSGYKYMATLHRDTAHDSADSGVALALVKGAPEAILQRCSSLYNSAAPFEIDTWHAHIDALAGQGNRVLALACKPFAADATLSHESIASDLQLVALVAIMDPPRDEAISAIEECHQAGIAVKMITGDHVQTAAAIGRMLHLKHPHNALTGSEIDQMDDEALSQALQDTDIFARTTPAHKLRLVTLLQAGNRAVAMTGDGVNDAPALKRADIGIAMGKGGTAAAREASEMVLTDDNFATIVKAVHEGRTVYDNLKKAITFLLPVNGGESLAIILALLIGLTLPIMPLQILWVNMVSSIALALALAFEASEDDVMRRPPRAPTEPWLSGFIIWRIGLVSVLFTAGIFAVFEWAQWQGYSDEYARTMAVNTLVAMEVWYLFSVRYLRRASFSIPDLKGTPPVLLAVMAVFVLQLLFTYSPWLQTLFASEPLSMQHGLLCVAVGIILFAILELEKWLQRRFKP